MTATFAQALLEDLQAFTTPATDPNGEHSSYLIALSQAFEEMYGLVVDQGFPDDGASYVPGWGSLFDVDLVDAKFLPYLAQFNGTVIPAGTDEATAREIVRSEAGMARGTPPAMIAAAQRNLTGDKYVLFLERTAADGSPDAYHLVIGLRSAECGLTAGLYTALDAATSAVIAAVEAIKPGGIQITYDVTDAWTIGVLEGAEALISNVEADFATVGGVELDSPGL